MKAVRSLRLRRRQLVLAGPAGSPYRSFSSSTSSRATWGFVGLGRMGYPMARNLRAKLAATDTLLIHDLNADATQNFINEAKTSDGATARVAGTARELAEQSDNVITVLPEPSHVKNLFHSMINSGLPKLNDGGERLFIDCSTIDPSSSREVANAVHCTNAGKFVDAPMSGGVVGAEAGTLTFMLGAPQSLVHRTNPILSMMGRSVHHCGEQGAGLSAKLANNYLLALCNIATAEAMNLGIKWGLDPKVLAGLINVSSGRSWCSEVNNPVPGVVGAAPASRDYKGGFAVGLMKKDLNLAIAAAREANARLELHESAREVYEAVDHDERCKGRDFSVVYRYLGGAE